MIKENNKSSDVEQDSSVIGTGLAVAPLVAGGYLTAKNFPRSAFSPGLTSSNTQMDGMIRAAQRYSQNMVGTGTVDVLASRIRGGLGYMPPTGTFSPHEQISAIKMAWEEAAKAVDPNVGVMPQIRWSQFNRNQDAFEAVSSMLRSRQSAHTSQLASRFMSNLHAIQGHMQVTKTLPAFMPVPVKEGGFGLMTKVPLTSVKNNLIRTSLEEMQRGLSTQSSLATMTLQKFTRTGSPGSTLRATFSGGVLGKHEMPIDIHRRLRKGDLWLPNGLESNMVIRHSDVPSAYGAYPVDVLDPRTGKIVSTLKNDEWIARR